VPGAATLVVLFFEAKELLDDAAALASQLGQTDRDAYPQGSLATRIRTRSGVALTAKGDGDEDGQDGPQLSLFAVPGNDGLFGLGPRAGERRERKEERAVGDLRRVVVIDASVGSG
jgi:hypothetical protein